MLYYISGSMCQRVITDERTHSSSYIDDLAGMEINLPNIPANIPPFVVSTTLGRDKKDKTDGYELRMVIRIPSGKEIPSGPFPVKFDEDKLISRLHIEIPNFPATEEGSYFINIEIKNKNSWSTVAKIPFIVKKDIEQGQSGKSSK